MDRKDSSEYASVLEGIPVKKPEMFQDAILGLLAEMFLDKTLVQFKLQTLYQQIDRSLECGDEETFFQLTNELKALKNVEC